MNVVAGVTGHVGSVVARHLLSKKQPVRVIVRSAEKGAAWAAEGAEVAVGSLDDAGFLSRALASAKAFFALLPPNFQAPDFFAFQKATSEAIAAAVRTSGVRHVVLLSSVGAHHPAGTGPIRGLYVLERALRETGVVLSAIRAGSFQENVRMAVAPAMQMGIYLSFAASADFAVPQIATVDIAQLASQLILENPQRGEVVDLQGPAYSSRQVAETLGTALGKKLQVVDVPPQGVVDAMMKGGMSRNLAELFAEMHDGANKGLLVPVGDRLVQGKTTLDETIKNVVRGLSAPTT